MMLCDDVSHMDVDDVQRGGSGVPEEEGSTQGDLLGSNNNDIERLYGEQATNPAQAREKPWVHDPEYFQRCVPCCFCVSCGPSYE